MECILQAQQIENQLSTFGLNPKDWRVVPLNERLIEVRSHDEDGFFFVGELRGNSNRVEINHLSLVEI
jgi:hypothetical protein